ncbi:pirin family protein [Staphylospora marina]|uniref:pirin family protein n=1 Tax=Staphylospora marina TaxID=2490858 RepID=UPI000F5B937B|nr:pirin family protein [Staphylospora marina]
MIRIIRSEERFHADYGWLDTRYGFSFAGYWDPENVRFGSLRVFNEDVIQPRGGFDTHPHDNMEIMTYVISGALEHRDSMGNREVIRAGEIQTMTAGTGILHSEHNPSDTEPVHLLQIWFLPERRNLSPSYAQKRFSEDDMKNRLLPVVSGRKVEGTLHLNQDVTVYLSRMDAGHELDFVQEEGRRIHLFVIGGEVEVSGNTLKEGDAARVTDLPRLSLKALSNAHLMLMDLA